MVHLLASVAGRNRRIYHGTVVTVAENKPDRWRWGRRKQATGRVYSLRTGSETVLVRYRDSEGWFPVSDIIAVHTRRPILAEKARGRKQLVYVGSHVTTTGGVCDVEGRGNGGGWGNGVGRGNGGGWGNGVGWGFQRSLCLHCR